MNANRHDPYGTFNFRVRWEGKVVAGVSKVTLKEVAQVVSHREGDDLSGTHMSAGLTKHEPITLELGVTHDREFVQWVKLIRTAGANPETSLKNFRKDIVVELHNERGTLVTAWKFYRCWVSEYEGPLFNGKANDVAFERLTIQNEGWERDTSVVEPAES